MTENFLHRKGFTKEWFFTGCLLAWNLLLLILNLPRYVWNFGRGALAIYRRQIGLHEAKTRKVAERIDRIRNPRKYNHDFQPERN